jgi:hypothetical protein
MLQEVSSLFKLLKRNTGSRRERKVNDAEGRKENTMNLFAVLCGLFALRSLREPAAK